MNRMVKFIALLKNLYKFIIASLFAYLTIVIFTNDVYSRRAFDVIILLPVLIIHFTYLLMCVLAPFAIISLIMNR